MKYAIPVSGSRLSAHFGQSTEFMLIDADENNGQLTNKETLSTTPHNCGKPARTASGQRGIGSLGRRDGHGATPGF